MTLDEAKQAILNHFVAEWDDETAYTFENEDFDPAEQGLSEWVRVSVREQDSRQRTLGRTGNRRFERPSSVFVQIFTKVGEGGTQRADQLVQKARSILEGTNEIDGVWMFAGRAMTQNHDEYWHRVVVEVEFSYDETK